MGRGTAGMRKVTRRQEAKKWLSLVEEQVRSGLTQVEFCVGKGVTMALFQKWKYQVLPELGIDTRSVRQRAASRRFVPVEIVAKRPDAKEMMPPSSGQTGSGIIVVVGQEGIVVEPGFDAQTLDRVVAVLQARRC